MKKYSDGIYLFYSDWCIPSMKQLKELESMISTRGYTFRFIDVYKENKISKDFGITILPTTLILKGNRPIKSFIGVTSKKIMGEYM